MFKVLESFIWLHILYIGDVTNLSIWWLCQLNMFCQGKEMIINFFSEGLPYFLKEKMRIYFLLLGEEDCGFLNFLTDIHDIEKDNIIIYQVHHLRYIRWWNWPTVQDIYKMWWLMRYLEGEDGNMRYLEGKLNDIWKGKIVTYEISGRGRRWLFQDIWRRKMETLRYLVKMVTNNTIYLEEKDGNLRDIWNGKMVVMGAGETLWVRVGSCVLSRRSQTSTLPSFLEM